MKARNAVIVDGVRCPFARGGRGKLEATRLDEVGALLIRTLLERNPKVKPTMIADIGIGHGANQQDLAGLGNVARLAGLPYETTNFMSNRQCGSSMETAQRIAMAIMLGSYDCGISLGIEKMGRGMRGAGDMSHLNRTNNFNPRLMELNEIQSKMAHDHFEYFSTPIPDFLLKLNIMQSMVQTAQNVVEMFGLTRQDMDAFTVSSQQNLGAAYAAGKYKDEVIPLQVEDPVFDDKGNWLADEKGPMITFDTDESLRANTTMEGLAKLGPVKGIVSHSGQELSITAGNSCPTNSGVSTVLIMAEEMALQLGLNPLTRIVGWAVGGVKQSIMGVGPVVAIKKALKHAGLAAEQIDRVEFNEAFAAQVIPTLKETGISNDKVNVNGGSLGIGHPIGATGARLLLTVSHELRRSGKRYGLATQCIGAGQGIATILENVDAA
ncbi:MAG: thiolase family protein [Proteobacteria bacterium]|nr:thiolase family protein [Pseudomonadota bacterium]